MGQQQSVQLPWNQASITALGNAIAQGIMEIRHEGRLIRYASIPQMQQLLDRMVRYVNSQGDNAAPVNFRPCVYVRR